jgi:hypothetical protein
VCVETGSRPELDVGVAGAGNGPEAVALPRAIAGLESLDGHESDDETMDQEQRQEQHSAYAEYVKCVLAFAEGGGGAGDE